MNTTKKIVLVTGASGFVGSNLTRTLLEKQYEVHIILREKSKTWRLDDIADKLTIHRGDLLDPNWVESTVKNVHPSYIFNLVQYGGYPTQTDPGKIWSTNLTATVNLLNAAEKVGFEKFVQIGSSSEYGRKDAPMEESNLIEPNTVYGISKAAASLYCAHRGRDGNLPIVILRLFSVYGPWEESARLIPSLVVKYLSGAPVELVAPKIARDFVYIDDVVQALMLSLDKKVSGEIINIASGKQTTLEEIWNILSHIAGAPVAVIWGKVAGRSFDTNIWVGNPHRATTILGWQAKTSLEEGLQKTITWFKKYKQLYDNR